MSQALALLGQTYGRYCLDIAGSPISIDGHIAVAAARFVNLSAWYLVRHDVGKNDLQRDLIMPDRPTTPSDHLSADLTFRFLPQIYSRARARAPDDALTQTLALTLRSWPLSGVLSPIDEAPLSPLAFGGHTGLALLYAERLAQNNKPNWHPVAGLARDYVELVYQASGKSFQGKQSLSI
jgi:hypothetical protein